MKLVLSALLTCLPITLILFNSACSGPKHIKKSITNKDSVITKIVIDNNSNADSTIQVQNIVDSIKKKYIDYNTFNATINADFYSIDTKEKNLILNIRIKKDSVIWINVSKSVFNAARIIITKDTLIIINKLSNEVTIRPYSYLQKVIQIPLEFASLEELLIGNPLYFALPINTLQKNANTTTLLTTNALFKHLLTISNNNYEIQRSKLDDIEVTRNRTVDISYDDYETKNGISFSQNRTILISEKNKIEVYLKFKKYAFNEVQTYPINIPNSYKRL